MNTAAALPSLFVSHGSPMIALQPGATGAFLRRLGPLIERHLGRPRAILAVSAHTLTRQPLLRAAPRHEALHDFGGFPQALFELRYDAPGAPGLAGETAALLAQAGIQARTVDEGGLDHGIWTALMHLWPGADLPVLPLSLQPQASPADLFALGQALAPLSQQGVLVLGTGSITHNLRLLSFSPAQEHPPERAESAAFRRWVLERSQAQDWASLFDYRRQAPHAALMHPTDEHWLPFYVAAGVGGATETPQRLHAAVTYGALGMDAYAFGPQARALAEVVAHSESGGP